MKNIAVMGGTFNPIHNGHLILANQVLEQYGLDQVIFIPNHLPPHKEVHSLICRNHRYEMTQLAIEPFKKFILSDMELKREGVSYTSDTLSALKKMMNPEKLYFIIGSDALFGLETWNKAEMLLKEFKFIVGTRPGVCQEKVQNKIGYLNNKYADNITSIIFEGMDISSSQIREKIGRGEDVTPFLPEKVYTYIKENYLYLRSKSNHDI